MKGFLPFAFARVVFHAVNFSMKKVTRCSGGSFGQCGASLSASFFFLDSSKGFLWVFLGERLGSLTGMDDEGSVD